MNQTAIKHGMGAVLATAFALLLVLGTGIASAQKPQYLDDGLIQNSDGGWDLPYAGTCMVTGNAGNSIPTRPECVATRFPSYTTSSTCTGAGGSWTSGTSSVCKDLVNNTALTCVDTAGIDRLWNATDGFCVLTLKGYNRNRAVCEVQQGGTWSTWGSGKCVGSWFMPPSADPIWTPPLYTSVTNPGPGDQCLRCHRSDTEWNSTRIRDTEDYMMTGHRNMARLVAPSGPTSGFPWGGPPFFCSNPLYENEDDCVHNGGTWTPTEYPSNDTGFEFDWANGQIDVSLTSTPDWRDLRWIYGDWLGPLPRAIYDAGSYTSGPNNGKPLMSYSCARCHTTGWTSDAAINTATDIHGKEPELTFPGITWDGATLGTTGKVNLASGVSGDPNPLYSSWDLYGIGCARCHGSAIADADGSCSVANLLDSTSCAAGGGTWTAGNPRPAVPGRGTTHHADFTNYDGVNGGYCLDPKLRNATKVICEYFGSTWYSQCSDDRWGTKALCTGTAGCINPNNSHGLSYADEATCEAATAGECTIPWFTTQTPCTAGGGTWTAADTTWWTAKSTGTWKESYCSIGTCSNPMYTDPATCVGNGATWTNTWNDLFACDDAGGHWTGTKERRGQIITNLCMDCHRQETQGQPYVSADPAGSLKVGPAHGTFGFVSHPHGNWYLNSPHAKFTGTYSQIPSGKFEYNMSGAYKSWFMTEGHAGNTGNGCTGCHDVHKSTVKGTFQEGAIHEECMECHNKNLDTMLHPATRGTPLEHKDTDPMEACVSCHMPEGNHLFRINVDPAYEPFPTAAITATSSAQCTAIGGTWSASAGTCTVNAPQAADGDYTKAVWVDLDQACGKCHGGGVAYAETTGNSDPNSASITVASTTGFVAGERVKVVGAGAFTYDDTSYSVGDFESFIKSVDSPTQLTLLGKPAVALTGTEVVQNPTEYGAGYISKAGLADYARGIHNDAPVANFTYQLGNPNTLEVTFDASSSTCSGDNLNCDAFEWDFGDGNTDEGLNVVHTYATGGTKTVTLTVHEYGVGEATKTKKIKVYVADLPPVISTVPINPCGWNADNWTMTVTDTSSDDNGIVQMMVTWGDGSMTWSDSTAPFGPAVHTYLGPGFFTVTYKVTDTIGQVAQHTCLANPAYFTLTGTAFRSNGTTVVSGVKLTFVRNGAVAKTVYTNALGVYTATNLKPGSYTVYATKAGYTFPISNWAIGPVLPPPAYNIVATAP